jgi:hypothetical protein
MFRGMESPVTSLLNCFVGAEIRGLEYETGFFCQTVPHFFFGGGIHQRLPIARFKKCEVQDKMR